MLSTPSVAPGDKERVVVGIELLERLRRVVLRDRELPASDVSDVSDASIEESLENERCLSCRVPSLRN